MTNIKEQNRERGKKICIFAFISSDVVFPEHELPPLNVIHKHQ